MARVQAYVTLSLIERNPGIVPPTTISSAESFVVEETPNISEDFYARVLVAYVLELIGSDSALIK